MAARPWPVCPAVYAGRTGCAAGVRRGCRTRVPAAVLPNGHARSPSPLLVPSHGAARLQVLRDLRVPHFLLHLRRADSRVAEVSTCGSPRGPSPGAPPRGPRQA